jgi:hypothetical protein
MPKVIPVTAEMMDARRVEKAAGLKQQTIAAPPAPEPRVHPAAIQPAPLPTVSIPAVVVPEPNLAPETKRRIITLCGSTTKAGDQIRAESVRLTIAGNIVLIPNVDMTSAKGLFETTKECPSCHNKPGLIQICTLCNHVGTVQAIDEKQMAAVKGRLDALHLEKIAMSDLVHFVNVKGYFGESTTSELKHSMLLKKSLSFFESDKAPFKLLAEAGYSEQNSEWTC